MRQCEIVNQLSKQRTTIKQQAEIDISQRRTSTVSEFKQGFLLRSEGLFISRLSMSAESFEDQSLRDQAIQLTCETYCRREALTRMGIDHSKAIVIYDEAESGTKVFRDEFARLKAMMESGQIVILAVDDQSRLSRADNTFAFITDLVYSGGRFISTGEGIDTEQTGWELRVKVMELHNSTTIRELGRRVRRGQLGRILSQLSAGDYCYGYESYLLNPEKAAEGRGPKPERGLRIKEDDAKWVRQIFEWFNEKRSIAWIAEELTRQNGSIWAVTIAARTTTAVN